MKQFIQIMKVFKPLLRKVLFPISKPTSMVGLVKWMMGWMHDTLEYFQKRPSTENTTKMT
jgi:hypothetical protein